MRKAEKRYNREKLKRSEIEDGSPANQQTLPNAFIKEKTEMF